MQSGTASPGRRGGRRAPGLRLAAGHVWAEPAGLGPPTPTLHSSRRAGQRGPPGSADLTGGRRGAHEASSPSAASPARESPKFPAVGPGRLAPASSWRPARQPPAAATPRSAGGSRLLARSKRAPGRERLGCRLGRKPPRPTPFFRRLRRLHPDVQPAAHRHQLRAARGGARAPRATELSRPSLARPARPERPQAGGSAPRRIRAALRRGAPALTPSAGGARHALRI